MENAPIVVEPEYKVVNIEDYAMTADRLVKQVVLVQQVMEKVMKENEHFGIIPGCQKPSLYKPGAEKLSVTFRLVPKYEIKQVDFPNGHREMQVKCTLIHAPSGQFFGQGVGSCTTMEGKYRYRNAEPEITETPVPKQYWNLRKANKLDEAQKLIGGKGFVTKKTDKGWFIAKKSDDKMEHDNPADYYNTVLKMAKKRAHVDAVLTATAASDIFTQDIEDMPEVIQGVSEKVENTKPQPDKEQKKKSSAKKKPAAKKEPSNGERPLLKEQGEKLIELGVEKGLSESETRNIIDWYCQDAGRTHKSGQEMIENFDLLLSSYLESQERDG